MVDCSPERKSVACNGERRFSQSNTSPQRLFASMTTPSESTIATASRAASVDALCRADRLASCSVCRRRRSGLQTNLLSQCEYPKESNDANCKKGESHDLQCLGVPERLSGNHSQIIHIFDEQREGFRCTCLGRRQFADPHQFDLFGLSKRYWDSCIFKDSRSEVNIVMSDSQLDGISHLNHLFQGSRHTDQAIVLVDPLEFDGHFFVPVLSGRHCQLFESRVREESDLLRGGRESPPCLLIGRCLAHRRSQFDTGSGVLQQRACAFQHEVSVDLRLRTTPFPSVLVNRLA